MGTRAPSSSPRTDASAPSLLSSLVELVLPRACVGCAQPGSLWCADCLTVEFRPELHRPDPCPPALPMLATAASYSGSVRAAILAAKERDRRELDHSMGALMAAAVAVLVRSGLGGSNQFGPLWLVPVPTSPSARRERGRDHLRDWTRWTMRELTSAGIRARCVPALRRRPGGVDSIGLDADQRADNLRGAFAMSHGRAPSPDTMVVIVDDIVTTGATLVAATDCLSVGLDRDPARLGAAVVGATQRRRAQ